MKIHQTKHPIREKTLDSRLVQNLIPLFRINAGELFCALNTVNPPTEEKAADPKAAFFKKFLLVVMQIGLYLILS